MRSFRVSFDPKVSKFKIEIMGFLGLFWTPARIEARSEPNAIRYFPTYAEAMAAVEGMGLNKIYQDATTGQPWGQVRQSEPRDYPFNGFQPTTR